MNGGIGGKTARAIRLYDGKAENSKVLDVYAASEEDYRIIRELSMQADKEARIFFGEIKTLEEATGTVQNRVELYLEEQGRNVLHRLSGKKWGCRIKKFGVSQ